MTIKIFGCGGAGINIMRSYLERGAFKDDIEYIGLDTSDRDSFESEKVAFEYVAGTFGSGGDTSLNSEKYPAFLKKVVTQHGPGDIAIVIYSGSGGTGPAMGPSLHYTLLEMNIPTISIVVGDMSNINGATNTVGALLNLNSHTSLGHPVLYSYRENGNGRTEGQVNDDIRSVIDVLYVMFSDKNHRIDKMDIHNFFFYNNVVKAAPTLSCVEILSNGGEKNYSNNAVAALSMFDNQDNVRPILQDLLYAKAGIFADDFITDKYSDIHLVLDHGDSIRALQEMLERQRSINAKVNDRFQMANSSIGEKSAKSGVYTKFDI